MNNLNLIKFMLSAELQRRQVKNLSYSMRAFARDIGVSPSHLSACLGGSGRLSGRTLQKIFKELNWDDTDLPEHIFTSIAHEEVGSKTTARLLASGGMSFGGPKVSDDVALKCRQMHRVEFFCLSTQQYEELEKKLRHVLGSYLNSLKSLPATEDLIPLCLSMHMFAVAPSECGTTS